MTEILQFILSSPAKAIFALILVWLFGSILLRLTGTFFR